MPLNIKKLSVKFTRNIGDVEIQWNCLGNYFHHYFNPSGELLKTFEKLLFSHGLRKKNKFARSSGELRGICRKITKLKIKVFLWFSRISGE